MASVTGVEWKIQGQRFIMAFDDHINFSTDSEKNKCIDSIQDNDFETEFSYLNLGY